MDTATNMAELEILFAKDNGMTVAEFNAKSRKDATKLLQETRKKVTLGWHKKRQRLVRFARGVGVAVVTTNGLWLRQVACRYPKSGKISYKIKNITISGTQRRGKGPVEEAIRELEEELRLSFRPEDLRFLGKEVPDWHESTAYHRFLSCNLMQTVIVEISSPPRSWKPYPVFRDGDKYVHCEWNPCEFPFMPDRQDMPHREVFTGLGLELTPELEIDSSFEPFDELLDAIE